MSASVTEIEGKPKAKRPLVNATRLRELVDYDPHTGIFIRKITCRGGSAGSIAGKRHCEGYLQLSIDGRCYFLHRLAWLYVYGEFPSDQIDHINGDRADNRIINLRPATHTENMRNRCRHRNGSSGFKGVYRERGKWCARITIRAGRRLYLGRFDTPEEAHAAYFAAAQKHFGEFASDGTEANGDKPLGTYPSRREAANAIMARVS